MTATTSDQPVSTSTRFSRPVRFVVGVIRQTLVEPIAAGRLRDEGWPFGLRAVVVLAYVMFGLAALVVLISGAIRRSSTLVISGTSSIGIPDGLVWPLIILLSFGAAALMTAVLHGPVWLRIVGLLFAWTIMASWSLRGFGIAYGRLWVIGAGVLMVALLVLVIIRWRRSFRWWEFAVVWGLIGGSLLVGLAESKRSDAFGFDFNVQLLQSTAQALGFFALPAAMVAGAAVAEIVVGGTVSAVRQAQRLAHRRWPFLLLGAVILLRIGFEIQRYRERVPGSVGWSDYLPAAAIVIAFAVIGLVVLRVGRHRGGAIVLSELPEELTAIGFVVAGALIAVQIPVQLGITVLLTLATLDPAGPAAQNGLNTSFVAKVVDPLRMVIGAVLVGLAVRSARRGRTARGLVQGCVGVMLLALARNFLFPDLTLGLDPDVLNLVGSLVVVTAIVVTLVRRRLTGERALAYGGALILSALFSARDFISDPLGYLIGFSGAALVLFGLTWDLLTGSDWGNGDSRRFPRATRVLLVLTNAVLTMTVLAYAALIRDGSTTIYLDPFASFGDLIFGTALVAAAVLATVDAAAHGERIT